MDKFYVETAICGVCDLSRLSNRRNKFDRVLELLYKTCSMMNVGVHTLLLLRLYNFSNLAKPFLDLNSVTLDSGLNEPYDVLCGFSPAVYLTKSATDVIPSILLLRIVENYLCRIILN